MILLYTNYAPCQRGQVTADNESIIAHNENNSDGAAK